MSLLRRTFQYFEIDRASDINVIDAFYFLLIERKELLERALQLVDEHSIVKVVNTTGNRFFWLAAGSNRKDYRVLESYCPCKSYFEQIKGIKNPRYDDVLCKHIVAALVGSSLRRIEIHTVSNEEFVDILGGKKEFYSRSFQSTSVPEMTTTSLNL
jgi:predicted nucleic acid-binding Zn finger protein